MRLNVFRVGTSPRLKTAKGAANDIHMTDTHTHFTYEVLFITSGKLKLVTDRYITEYTKSILIVPPQTKHFTVPIGGESYCLLFSFEKNARFEEQLNQGVCELPMSDEIAFYIKTFTEKSIDTSAFAEEDAKHLAALIFNNILVHLKSNNLETQNISKHTSKHINIIEGYINNNIYNKFTLSDIAEHMFLSPTQISRIIKKEYGCSFSALVTEKRLAIAAVMLKNTDMKISEIANQTFCTEKYFYNMFKAKYGMSPLKYRKEIRILEK